MFHVSLSTQRLLSKKITTTATAFNRTFIIGNNYQKRIFENCKFLSLSRNISTVSLFLTSGSNTVYSYSSRHQRNLYSQQKFENITRFLTTSSSTMNAENQNKPKNSSALIVKDLTKNLIYFTERPFNSKINKTTLKFSDPDAIGQRPLVLIFSWMLATKNHLSKYVRIYTDLGFDAVAVNITPWQLLWPVKGTQIVTEDLLKFLYNNQDMYEPIVIHGFSVGGYLCGEVLVHMTKDLKKYESLLNKFHAQVWDSAADITEIPKGFPTALFPNNPYMQKIFRNYVIYHMKTFYNQATIHYIRSSQMFHKTLIKAPALFLVSKNDPIGAEESNLSVKNDWESIGIKCTWKCWERSKHVSHFKHHTDEYLKLVLKHLDDNVVKRLPENNRLKAKL